MAGLLEWSNALRLTMATDPGRQLFQDQLHTHGFIFLNDYLDNILSRPHQDPIIEFVKTPGRKKVISKKPKNLGTSKLHNTISLEGDEIHKENLAPINSFHEALLKVKDETDMKATKTHQSKLPSQLPFAPTEAQPNSMEPLTSQLDLREPPAATDLLNPALLAPSRADQNDLSVIAEDDENSEANSLPKRRSYSDDLPRSSRTQVDNVPMDSNCVPADPSSNATDITESSMDSFHSIPLVSPREKPQPDHRTLAPSPASEMDVKSNSKSEHYTAPLPEIPPWNPHRIQEEAMTAPLTATSTSMVGQDITIPLRDHDQAPSSPKGGDTKFGVPLFPSLPGPMPLRKSMRTPRDPSMGTGPLGAATPGVPPGGKRTSWLKKAREVKALEVTVKHVNVLQPVPSTSTIPPAPSTSNALKRKSGDISVTPATTGLEREERRPKSSKSQSSDVAPLKAAPEPQLQPPPQQPAIDDAPVAQEGMLDRFKRTVEGLGARVGKSMGKSLGPGAAVSALAEARAAAEARVAERHHKEEEMTRVTTPVSALPSVDIAPTPEIQVASAEPEPVGKRLSVSDLFPPNDGSVKMKSKAGQSFQFSTPPLEPSAGRKDKVNRESTTTTPPDSPPASHATSFILPTGPVFNKPPPVFVAQVPTAKSPPNDSAVHLPPPVSLSIHTSAALGLSPRIPSHPFSKQLAPLSKQSTMESVKSDAIFDDTDVPAWIPNTQDTEYSSAFGSQSHHPHQTVLDEDDSWPIDDKLVAGGQWTFGTHANEDSMTWSTLPSQSQRADTGRSQIYQPPHQGDACHSTNGIPGAFIIDVEEDQDMEEDQEDADFAQGDSEVEDGAPNAKSTVSIVETKITRSESQMSMASSQSSQSQPGFLGQASKLLSSALGTSKKGKPEVKKVLQMAAVAAKKQQEENDKKAARLKEMENRRQLANQRKAEEEKARTLDQERKMKEEGERRKREREENTDKRPLKTAVKKDEDTTKKRKITVQETEKKELKKLPSKTALKSSMKQPTALSSSAAYNASLQTNTGAGPSKAGEVKALKYALSSTQKGIGKPTPKPTPVPDDDLSQPSQLVQIQMAARAKAQLQAAHIAPEPPIASESIELPEIDSEYSDSDDEDRPKSFPEWAQSPELREALQIQSTINPDDIFGAIRPLRMEELFKNRTSRFRARTSSANWTGADRLTLEEERAYARRMGFK